MTISKKIEDSNTISVPMENLLSSIDTFYDTLIQNNVAVIQLDISNTERDSALENTPFYNTINDVFREEFKISEPNLNQKLNPTLIKNKAPDTDKGWIHQYATPIHHLVQMDPKYRTIMKQIYNIDGDTILHKPNRLRYSSKSTRSTNTIHFDGKPFVKLDNGDVVLDNKPIIASIIGITGLRKFVWWDLKNQSLSPIYDYWKNKGEKNFTPIDAEFMYEYYPNCRRMVNVDCSKNIYLIAFLENTPHEIASTPNLSIFLSPVYNFNHNKNKTTTTFQPLEFTNLTQHESDLLAICYQMGGSHWPSEKKLYQSYHTQAYSHYKPKTDLYYIDNTRDSHQMKLIRNGTINQKTDEYKEKLKKLNIKLPNISFERNTPNFVIDITELPIQILYDYGFIKNN